MPPLPVLCRAMLVSSLKGTPVQVLPSVRPALLAEKALDLNLLPHRSQAGRDHVQALNATASPSFESSNPPGAAKEPLLERVEGAQGNVPAESAAETAARMEREREKFLQEVWSLSGAVKASLSLTGLAVLFLIGLLQGAVAEEEKERAQKAALLATLAARPLECPKPPAPQHLGQIAWQWWLRPPSQETSPKASSQASGPAAERPWPEEKAEAQAESILKLEDDAKLPVVSPPVMRACDGVRLVVPLPGASPQLPWSANVSGAGTLTSLRGPPVQFLSLTLRQDTSLGPDSQVLELMEMGPSRSAQRPGMALLSVCPGMEICVGAATESGRRPLGVLHAIGGGRYLLRQSGLEGRALLALSAGPSCRRIEVGAVPSGRLLATALRQQADHSTAAASIATEQLEVISKPGIDAALALTCALAVILHGQGPERAHQHKPEGKLAERAEKRAVEEAT